MALRVGGWSRIKVEVPEQRSRFLMDGAMFAIPFGRTEDQEGDNKPLVQCVAAPWVAFYQERRFENDFLNGQI